MKYIDNKNKKMPVKNKNIILIVFLKNIIKKKIEKTLSFDEFKIESSPEIFEKLKKELNDDFEDKMKKIEDEKTENDFGSFKDFLKEENIKRPEPCDNYFSSASLIIDMPEELRTIVDELEKRKLFNEYTLAIDSRSRNHDLYDENKYVLDLNQRFRNIKSVELKYINLPNSDYIINDSNNTFIIQETSGEDIIINLTEGNYNKASLLTEIQTQLNNTGSSTYTVQNSTHSIINDYFDGPTQRITQTDGSAWLAFDNQDDTHWESDTNTNQIIYELDNSHTLTKYSFYVSGDPGKGRPRDWTVEVSNDKNNWTLIDTQVNPLYSYFEKKQFTIANIIPGRFIRITITETSNSLDMALSEINFYKSDTSKIDFVSDLTGGSGIFSLTFPSTTGLREILGFSELEYSGYNIYTTEGQFNLNLFNQYIYMYFNGFNQIEGSVDDNKRFYSLIPMVSDKNNYTTYNVESNENSIYFPDFKTEVSKLDIEFKRYDGSLVNFNGLDHDFVIVIKTINLQDMD